MISINLNDQYLIEHCGFRRPVKLSMGTFIVKGSSNSSILKNELIGQKLAQIFGLNCPKYHFVQIHDYYYILSEDLNQSGIFRNASELSNLTDQCKMEEAITSLEYHLSKKMIMDLFKIYIFDILFLNHDRDPLNWGILFQKDGAKDIIVFDHESIFQSLLTLKFYYQDKYLYSDIRSFLKESSEELTHLFLYYYNMMNFNTLEKVLLEVEIENQIILENKENILKIYQNHYEKIGNILKNMEIYERK